MLSPEGRRKQGEENLKKLLQEQEQENVKQEQEKRDKDNYDSVGNRIISIDGRRMYKDDGSNVTYSDGRRIYNVIGMRVKYNADKTVDYGGDDDSEEESEEEKEKPQAHTPTAILELPKIIEKLKPYPLLGNLPDITEFMKTVTGVTDNNMPNKTDVIANKMPTASDLGDLMKSNTDVIANKMQITTGHIDDKADEKEKARVAQTIKDRDEIRAKIKKAEEEEKVRDAQNEKHAKQRGDEIEQMKLSLNEDTSKNALENKELMDRAKRTEQLLKNKPTTDGGDDDTKAKKDKTPKKEKQPKNETTFVEVNDKLKSIAMDPSGTLLKDDKGVDYWGRRLMTNNKNRTYIIEEKIKNKWRLVLDNSDKYFHNFTNVAKITKFNENIEFISMGDMVMTNNYRITLWTKELFFPIKRYK
jgi:hypothetical protein